MSPELSGVDDDDGDGEQVRVSLFSTYFDFRLISGISTTYIYIYIYIYIVLNMISNSL